MAYATLWIAILCGILRRGGEWWHFAPASEHLECPEGGAAKAE